MFPVENSKGACATTATGSYLDSNTVPVYSVYIGPTYLHCPQQVTTSCFNEETVADQTRKHPIWRPRGFTRESSAERQLLMKL